MDAIVYSLLKKKITSALTGIASITSDKNGKLIFVTNDGDTFTVSIPGAALLEDFTVTNGVGKAELGTEYKAGTAIADIVVDMLSTYAPPTITLKTDFTKDVFDKIEDKIGAIKISSKIVKGSKDIEKVSVFINNEVIATFEGDTLKENGEYNVDYIFNPETNETFIIKVTAYDGQNTTVTKTITFVGKSYWGYVEEAVEIPTEENIKGLQFNVVKNSRALTYSEIQIGYGKVLYAYPKVLGALSKIVDEDGRNYTGSYVMSEVTVDGLEYYCYLLKDAMGTDNGYQKFS